MHHGMHQLEINQLYSGIVDIHLASFMYQNCNLFIVS